MTNMSSIHLSLDQEAESLLENLENQINESFDGKSQFFKAMLEQYDKEPALEAKLDIINDAIKTHEQKIQDLQLQKQGIEEKLERISEKKEKKQKKTSKLEDLQELQNRKDRLEKQIKTDEEIRETVEQQYEENERHDLDDPRVEEAMEKNIERKQVKMEEKREELQEVKKQLEKVKEEYEEEVQVKNG